MLLLSFTKAIPLVYHQAPEAFGGFLSSLINYNWCQFSTDNRKRQLQTVNPLIFALTAYKIKSKYKNGRRNRKNSKTTKGSRHSL